MTWAQQAREISQVDKDLIHLIGGTVAEWSKVLLEKENINENQKIQPGQSLKKVF